MDERLIAVLSSRRKALKIEAMAIVDKAEKEHRPELSAAEEARFAEIKADIDLIDHELKSAARSGASVFEPTPTPAVPAPVGKYGPAASWGEIGAQVNAEMNRPASSSAANPPEQQQPPPPDSGIEDERDRRPKRAPERSDARGREWMTALIV